MNKIYKIIWSEVRQCYVVVAEIARNRGKNNVKSVVSRLAAECDLLVAEVHREGQVFVQKYSKGKPITEVKVTGTCNDTGFEFFICRIISRLGHSQRRFSRFNVSRQTVRQAIASLKAEGVIYQIQGSGTFISKETSERRGADSAFRNIFVICTYISEYIFPSIVRGIESTLNGTGYRIHIAATGNKVDLERKILNDVITLQ